MDLELVVAVASNGVIGRENKLPWKKGEILGDLKHFQTLTMGHPIIMGRNTYDSILDSNGEPLSGRLNVVLSRTKQLNRRLVSSYRSLQEAIEELQRHPQMQEIDYTKAIVIGGAQVYQEAMPQTSIMHITEIKKPYEGDTFFPNINMGEWKETQRTKKETHDFVTYKRN